MTSDLLCSRRRRLCPILLLVLGSGGALDAQCTRKARPTDQAFLKHVVAQLEQALPPLPAGWSELARGSGETVDADEYCESAALGVEFRWTIAPNRPDRGQPTGVDGLQKEWELAKANHPAAQEAAMKELKDWNAKMDAAVKAGDFKEQERLMREDKSRGSRLTSRDLMLGRLEGTGSISSDSEVELVLSVNPALLEAGTPRPAPSGVVAAFRHDATELTASSAKEATTYLLGKWRSEQEDGVRLWKAILPTNGVPAVHSIAITIKAPPARGAELFAGIKRARLQALLPK